MKKLNKSASCTDIHFGRRQNSEIHNQDCFDYITWFCNNVKADPTIDHVNFYGDWHEHRNAINGLTIDYSYRAAKQLDDLGIPVFFIIGNHDLYFRNNRNVYTTVPFESFKNFTVIKDITVIDNIGDHGAVYSPFLFESEFPRLLDYIQYPVLHGHLEFAGFVVTGDTIVKEHGPDHKLYKSFNRIFTGHYHKRQSLGNVHYIGSTHPMDYSDAGDTDRGMAIYDYKTDTIEYKNWDKCPTYTTCKLSKVISSPSSVLKAKGSVKAYVDVDVDQQEAITLREMLIKKYKLRELIFEENNNKTLDGDTTMDDELKMESVDTVVKHKLKTVNIDGIDAAMLVDMYGRLGNVNAN